MKKIIILAFTFLLAFSFGCKKEIIIDEGNDFTDWSKETHSNDVEANYDVVFDDLKINRIDIVLTADEWVAMQVDLAEVLSSGGGGGPGGGGMSFSNQTPQYFACDFYFNGKQWYNVGVRYKGNSSLQSTSRSNIAKLPFRLNFDEFEDEYPEINNQRFYGFKELALGNNFKDQSLMREKSASDLFRGFGVPAARVAFYEVYLDKGNGAEFMGVYSLNEIVFDTFLKDYFGSDNGNCYKPDGDGARFAATRFDLDDFELKTNESLNNKTDIEAMHDFIHASTRTSNSAQWRTDLESVFDVDGFLKYLAVNNTIQNWDTYGLMTHNYYLYHDPMDDLIKWIVWDNNEAFTAGVGNRNALSLGMTEVNTSWPLINYIVNDDVYLAKYKSYIKDFITNNFTVSSMNNVYGNQESLLYSSAEKDAAASSFISNIGGFTSAVNTLKTHCATRISLAESFVD